MVRQHALEFVFVGDLSEFDSGQVLEVRLDVADHFLPEALVLEQGHEEEDLPTLVQVALGDFERLFSVRKDHEGRREDDDIKFFSGLGDGIVVHFFDGHVRVLLKNVDRRGNIVSVDVDAQHLGCGRDLVDDRVEGVASSDADVQDALDVLLFEVPSGCHVLVGGDREVARVDHVIDHDGDQADDVSQEGDHRGEVFDESIQHEVNERFG